MHKCLICNGCLQPRNILTVPFWTRFLYCDFCKKWFLPVPILFNEFRLEDHTEELKKAGKI